MHHTDKGHDILERYVVLQWFSQARLLSTPALPHGLSAGSCSVHWQLDAGGGEPLVSCSVKHKQPVQR